jgi:hypothetical protein
LHVLEELDHSHYVEPCRRKPGIAVGVAGDDPTAPVSVIEGLGRDLDSIAGPAQAFCCGKEPALSVP